MNTLEQCHSWSFAFALDKLRDESIMITEVGDMDSSVAEFTLSTANVLPLNDNTLLFQLLSASLSLLAMT